MRTYEVWYDDIEGTHFVGTVKANSRVQAIEFLSHDLDVDVSLPQYTVYDMVNE